MSRGDPGFELDEIPTAEQWDADFVEKQDWHPILDAILARGGVPSFDRDLPASLSVQFGGVPLDASQWTIQGYLIGSSYTATVGLTISINSLAGAKTDGAMTVTGLPIALGSTGALLSVGSSTKVSDGDGLSVYMLADTMYFVKGRPTSLVSSVTGADLSPGAQINISGRYIATLPAFPTPTPTGAPTPTPTPTPLPTPVGVPVVPLGVQNLRQTARTNDQMTMSWDAPTQNSVGGPIVSELTYSLSYRLHGTPVYSAPVTGITDTSYAITSLTGGSAYDISVAATDDSLQTGEAVQVGPWDTDVTGLGFPNGSESPDGTTIDSTSGSIINQIGEVVTLSNLTLDFAVVFDGVASSDLTVSSVVYQNRRLWTQVIADDGEHQTFMRTYSGSQWEQFTDILGVPVELTIPPMSGGPPGQVTGLTNPNYGGRGSIDGITARSISYVWFAPETGQGPFTYGQAYKKHSDANWPDTIYGYRTSHGFELENLDPATAYDFRVLAIDVYGRLGDWTDIGPITTKSSDPSLPTVPSGAQLIYLGKQTGLFEDYDFESYNLFVAKFGGQTAHCAIYWDAGVFSDADGQSYCDMLLSVAEDVITRLTRIFGINPPLSTRGSFTVENPLGFLYNLIISDGWSYSGFHLSTTSTDVVFNLAAPFRNKDNYGLVLAAELAEVYMSYSSGLSKSDFFAFGEGLSQCIASVLFPNTSYLKSWITFWRFYGLDDYVNDDAQINTLAYYPGIGCSVYFIHWLRHLGYNFRQMMAAINGLPYPAHPRDIYTALTSDASDPFPVFLAEVNAFALDWSNPPNDPWNTPVVELSTDFPVSTVETVNLGSGPDLLVLYISGDYQPQFVVLVDGVQQSSGNLTAHANNSSGERGIFNISGSFGTGIHNVTVTLTSTSDDITQGFFGLYVTVASYRGTNIGAYGQLLEDSVTGHGGSSVFSYNFTGGSPSQTILTVTSGGSFTDSQGAVYTLAANGHFQQNGADVDGGQGTDEAAYVGGIVWARDKASQLWYQFVNGAFINQTSTDPTTTAVTNPTYVILTPTSGGSVHDSAGNTFTLSGAGEFTMNGQVIDGGQGTDMVTSVNGVVYAREGSTGLWFMFANGIFSNQTLTDPTGGAGVAPVPTIPQIPGPVTL